MIIAYQDIEETGNFAAINEGWLALFNLLFKNHMGVGK